MAASGGDAPAVPTHFAVVAPPSFMAVGAARQRVRAKQFHVARMQGLAPGERISPSRSAVLPPQPPVHKRASEINFRVKQDRLRREYEELQRDAAQSANPLKRPFLRERHSGNPREWKIHDNPSGRTYMGAPQVSRAPGNDGSGEYFVLRVDLSRAEMTAYPASLIIFRKGPGALAPKTLEEAEERQRRRREERERKRKRRGLPQALRDAKAEDEAGARAGAGRAAAVKGEGEGEDEEDGGAEEAQMQRLTMLLKGKKPPPPPPSSSASANGRRARRREGEGEEGEDDEDERVLPEEEDEEEDEEDEDEEEGEGEGEDGAEDAARGASIKGALAQMARSARRRAAEEGEEDEEDDDGDDVGDPEEDELSGDSEDEGAVRAPLPPPAPSSSSSSPPPSSSSSSSPAPSPPAAAAPAAPAAARGVKRVREAAPAKTADAAPRPASSSSGGGGDAEPESKRARTSEPRVTEALVREVFRRNGGVATMRVLVDSIGKETLAAPEERSRLLAIINRLARKKGDLLELRD
jgi:hypothetical protein